MNETHLLPESSPVTTPALAQLRQLQRTLYDKAYKEAHAIVGGSSRTILAYSAKFEKSLPRRFSRSTQADLLDAMKQHRFVLYGDFHTLRQSQRGLLRLLRAYVDKQKTNKIVIALEMFKAIDQDTLDGYLAGGIPEDEFLASVNYANEWGFPWPNFKMILDFARALRLPVIGINSENGGRDTLLARDRFAARTLVSAAEKYPHHKIVCLIGEYHLADGHLPKTLAAEVRRRELRGPLLRVLNNVDQFYFMMNREPAHSSTEYLRMRKDFYCIMNSPPWMKWQSFSIWEEVRYAGMPPPGEPAGALDYGLDQATEDAFDVDYQFLHFVRNLASFLQLEIDDSDIESFHIHYSPDGDFLRDLTQEGSVDVAEAGRMVGRAGADGVYFVARSNTVLLTNISINNLAEAAGQYLHTLLTGFDDASGANAGLDFYRRIFKAAIGMVGSKILNPRRKCMELHHVRQFLRRQKSRDVAARPPRRPPAVPEKVQTAAAVLRFDRWLEPRLVGTDPVPLASPPRAILQLDQALNYEISRSIGQMLGFTLYKKVIANKVPATRMKRLFKKQIPNDDALWQEVVRLYRLMS